MNEMIKFCTKQKNSSDVHGKNTHPVSENELKEAIISILRWIGEDPAREGLKETPQRIMKSLKEMFSGYELCPEEVLKRNFEEHGGYDDMVIVRNIPFSSHCEHHMAPIIGEACIAYFPQHRIVGLSKLARVVDIFARRLQTQERMTTEIASAIEKALAPRGTAVILEAEHMCMTMRGVRKKNSVTLTSAFTGIFQEKNEEKSRFVSMIRNGLSSM